MRPNGIAATTVEQVEQHREADAAVADEQCGAGDEHGRRDGDRQSAPQLAARRGKEPAAVGLLLILARTFVRHLMPPPPGARPSTGVALGCCALSTSSAALCLPSGAEFSRTTASSVSLRWSLRFGSFQTRVRSASTLSTKTFVSG